MAFELIDIPGLKAGLAAGLDWHSQMLSGEKVSSARKALLKGKKTPHGVFLSNSDSVALGLVTENKKQRGKLFSAAAIVALATPPEQRAVFIEPVGNGRVWFCAIQGGMPMATTDVLLNEHVAQSRAQEFVSGGFEIFPEGSLIKAWDQARKKKNRARISSVSSLDPSLLKIYVGVIALTIAAAGGMVVMQKTVKDRAKKLAFASAVSADAQKQEEIRLKRQARLQDIANKIVFENASSPIIGWLTSLEKLPLSTDGWKFAEMQCPTMSRCEVIYERSKGKIDQLQISLPGASTRISDIQKATVPLKSTLHTNPATVKGDSVAATLVVLTKENQVRLISLMQFLKNAGVNISSQEPKQDDLVPYVTMPFDVQGDGTGILRSVVQRLDGLGFQQSLQVKTLNLQLSSNKVTWRMKGEMAFRIDH